MDTYVQEEMDLDEGSIDYDLRSNESDTPSLEDVEVDVHSEDSLVYEVAASRYCEYEQYIVIGSWSQPDVNSRTCYEPKAGKSQFCHMHKCRTCDKQSARKSRYCMECLCPVVGCELKAYACGDRCSCCDNYHRSSKESNGVLQLVWRTCASCVCAVCGRGPVVERHGAWGDVLLCEEHQICVVVKCGHACDIDNPRYCPQHKHEICKQLQTLELCLLRQRQPRDIRLLFCRWFQWARENQQLCRICKGFHTQQNDLICQTCKNVREIGLKQIAKKIYKFGYTDK